MKSLKGAIIITSYNKENFIADAIESALSQKSDFQIYIILSDDASTDNSPLICQNYHENNKDKIIYLQSEKNIGLVANCYKCLDYALKLGVTYIIQLDCDDFLCDKDYFSNQVNFLENNPNYQVVFSKYHKVDESSHFSVYMEQISNKKSNLNYIYRKSDYTTKSLICKNLKYASGSAVYKTEHLALFLNDYATPDRIKHFKTQDLPLWLYLSTKGEFAECDANILAFRDLKESASRSREIAKIEEFAKNVLTIKEDFINFYKKGNISLKNCAKKAYQKKMIRNYAAYTPKQYFKKMQEIIIDEPIIIFSKDFFRSILIFFKGMVIKKKKG